VFTLLEIASCFVLSSSDDKEIPWVVILLIVLISFPFFYITFKLLLAGLKESFGFGVFTPYFKPTKKNKQFAFTVLAVHMIHSDRDKDLEQYRFLTSYIRRKFPDTTKKDFDDLRKLHELYSDYAKALRWVKTNFKEQEKTNLLDLLVDLAFFNGLISKRELYLIHAVGGEIGLSKEELRSILAIRYDRSRKQEERKKQKTHTGSRPSSNQKERVSAKVLGLTYSLSLTFDEVKKSYRTLTKKYHPDLFSTGTEEELEMANERFSEINTAYDHLKGILQN